MRREILDAASVLDAEFSCNLSTTLDTILPATTAACNKNNNDLAWDLVNLLAPLQGFMSKMEGQKEVQQMNIVSTRGASQDPPFFCV